MNGRDFLAAARRQAAGPDEADWRSAASRAYYAAFHAARELFASLRFRVPRANRAHNYLYVRLNNGGEPAALRSAAVLFELRRERNIADYDTPAAFARSRAARSVADAEDAVRILDGLSPAQRTAITDAMKVYEQGVGDVTWQP